MRAFNIVSYWARKGFGTFLMEFLSLATISNHSSLYPTFLLEIAYKQRNSRIYYQVSISDFLESSSAA